MFVTSTHIHEGNAICWESILQHWNKLEKMHFKHQVYLFRMCSWCTNTSILSSLRSIYSTVSKLIPDTRLFKKISSRVWQHVSAASMCKQTLKAFIWFHSRLVGIGELISSSGSLSTRISAETRIGSPEWEQNAFGEGGWKHGLLILVHRGQTNDSQSVNQERVTLEEMLLKPREASGWETRPWSL